MQLRRSNIFRTIVAMSDPADVDYGTTRLDCVSIVATRHEAGEIDDGAIVVEVYDVIHAAA